MRVVFQETAGGDERVWGVRHLEDENAPVMALSFSLFLRADFYFLRNSNSRIDRQCIHLFPLPSNIRKI